MNHSISLHKTLNIHIDQCFTFLRFKGIFIVVSVLQSDPSNMRYLWQLRRTLCIHGTNGNAFVHPSLYKTKYSLSTGLQCQVLSVPTLFGKFVMWIWQEPHPLNKVCFGHSYRQHFQEVQIKLQSQSFFYNNQEPLVTGTYSQSGASIQFICPFMRPRKTWEPLLTQDGPEAYEITNCGQYLWPIHFFRERRRAWAGLSRSCKEKEIWLMHIQLKQTQRLKITLSNFWRCSTLRQGPILLFTRLMISCMIKTK